MIETRSIILKWDNIERDKYHVYMWVNAFIK